MQEIKFRGLRTDGKGWAIGDFHDVPLRHGHRATIFINDGDEEEKDTGWVEVDRNSLGQYSLLNDKFGADLFEGDFVSYPISHVQHNHRIGLIVFERGMFLIEWKNTTWIGIKNCVADYYGLIEIIGNIHENTELLNA